MNAIHYEDVVDQLLRRIPEFVSVYNKHLEEHDQVLTHVLVADFVRFTKRVCDSIHKPTSELQNPKSILQRIVDFTEHAACSDDERVLELIQVSFMENLHQLDEYYVMVTALLGPRSKELLRSAES
jgi:hypothetical protein